MKLHLCPYTRTAYTCSTACRLHDLKAGCIIDQLQARHPERRLFAGLVRVPGPNKKPWPAGPEQKQHRAIK